jgi:hypothetical protein
MLQSEFIPKPPARSLPGSSNLSLLTGASQFDPAHVEKGELPETVTVDVSQWGVTVPETHSGGIAGTPIVAYEVGFNRHVRRSYFSPGFLDKSQHRSAYQIRAVYGTEVESEKYGEWIAGTLPAPRNEARKSEWEITGLMHIDDALRLILSTFLPNTARHVAARGGDALACLRELTEVEVRSLAQWMWYADHLSDNSYPPPLEESLALYAVFVQKVMDDIESNVIGVGGLEGAGTALYVVGPSNFSTRYDGEQDIEATVIDEDGLVHSHVELGSVGVVPKSPAWYAALLGYKVDSNVIHALNRRNGVENTFADLYDLGPHAFKEVGDFIGSDTVRSIEVWARLVKNFRTAGSLPVIAATGFEHGWIRQIVNDEAFPVANQIRDALRYGQQIQIGAVDIEEFAKTAVPDNPLVKSVKMLKNGKVRVVLREPVYPEFVLRRGCTYTENEPGTTLSFMAVHAFDLDFRGTLTQFPSATAYEDEECTKTARHTNITGAGHVCLGDINTKMSEQEIAARGGVAMPCVADFIQMLKQCNLDSAYHRDRNFVLADPSSVTDAQWEAKRWEIPGLRQVDQHMDDFKAFLAAMSTAPAQPAQEGEAE